LRRSISDSLDFIQSLIKKFGTQLKSFVKNIQVIHILLTYPVKYILGFNVALLYFVHFQNTYKLTMCYDFIFQENPKLILKELYFLLLVEFIF